MKQSDIYFFIAIMWQIGSWFVEGLFAKFSMIFLSFLFLIAMIFIAKGELNLKMLENRFESHKRMLEHRKFEALYDEVKEIKQLLKKKKR